MMASKRSVVVNNKKDTPGLKNCSLVWAIFSDRGSWQLARVARVDAQTLQVVEGRGDLPNEDQCCFLAIGGLPFSRARLVDVRRDVPTAAERCCWSTSKTHRFQNQHAMNYWSNTRAQRAG